MRRKNFKVLAASAMAFMMLISGASAFAQTDVSAIKPDEKTVIVIPSHCEKDNNCCCCDRHRPVPPMPCIPCEKPPQQQRCNHDTTKSKQEDNILRSDTGTLLNTRTEWKVTKKGDKNVIHVDVYAEYYTLFATGNEEGLKIKINNGDKVLEERTLSSPKISECENKPHETLINSCDFEVDSSVKELHIGVAWSYYGRYSKVQIDNILSSGMITTTEQTGQK